MSQNRRRKQFVDAAVQGALVRRMAGHWFLFLAISTVLMLGLQVLNDPFRPVGQHVTGFMQEHLFFLLLMACMTPIFLWDTVKLSNRFVGPVLRVQRALHEVNTGGEVSEVKFRNGDFWLEMADEVNALLARYNQLRKESQGSSETSERPEYKPAGTAPASPVVDLPASLGAESVQV